jgi:hypothetical protein
VAKKDSSPLTRALDALKSGAPDSMDQAKQRLANVVDDALNNPETGLLGLFGTLLAEVNANRPPPSPEDEAERERQTAKNLADIRRASERYVVRHRKARLARGLSGKAGDGKPEPRVNFVVTPAARRAPRLPLNPTSGDYESAKSKREAKVLAKLPLGASRFGGVPDLPPDLRWPTVQKKKLPFLAQIDLSTLPRAATKHLPKSGWLYAFGLFDDKRRKKDPVVLTVYQGKRAALSRAPAPKPNEMWPDAGCTTTYDLVPIEPRLAPPPKKDKYGDVDESTGRHGAGWLFGTVSPAFDTAGEIADQEFKDGGDWINLLAIESVGLMQWSDCGHLYFLIRRRDLVKGEFGKAFASVRSS